MTDVNSLTVIGRITRDLDENSFGYTNNGTARANVSIAVNRSRKNGDQWVDEVSYFDVAIWGKTAENLKPYLTKGAQIGVSGYLKQDRWEKDGKKNSRVSIVAEIVQLVGGKKESGDNPVKHDNGYQAANTVANAFGGNVQNNSGYGMPEDIPF